MNYLAHAYLAGDDESYRLGGILGDFVKGPLTADWPVEVAQGIALHRRIDSYAETHPAFQRSRARVSAERRRYAGIMVDMFYDHLLAAHWSHFSSELLPDFAFGIYDLLDRHHVVLPERLNRVRIWMREENWLCAYGTLTGVGRALDGMAMHRLSKPGTLPGAVEELSNQYAGFAADFYEFMYDAVRFSQAQRTTGN